MELKDLVRRNIWSLKPYSSARHEFEGEAEIFLDANENPFETDINRYPDPLQVRLKTKLAQIKNIATKNIFIGNGSDEAIDLLFRIFCEPEVDNVLIFPPTYGMYKVSADINNILVLESSLTTDYQIDVNDALNKINHKTKLAFLCSPNNPTGNLLDKNAVDQFISNFNGITIIDEAYIDFSQGNSCLALIENHPKVVILQTMSKAWGAAGLRLGLAYANSTIIDLMNKVKPPYNVNILSQNRALSILENPNTFQSNLQTLSVEREQLIDRLGSLKIVNRIHPSDANFLLLEFKYPVELFHYLRKQGIVVRDRTKTHLCTDCLRLTIGTPSENTKLIKAIEAFEISKAVK